MPQGWEATTLGASCNPCARTVIMQDLCSTPIRGCAIGRLCTRMWVCAHTGACECVLWQACTPIWGRGVDLHSGVMEGSQPSNSSEGSRHPPGSLSPAPPLPPPSSPHSSGPAAGSPPPTVSLRVLSVGEEESSLMDGSALDAAHLCFQAGGWSTAGVSAAPVEMWGVEARLPGVPHISQVAFWDAYMRLLS